LSAQDFVVADADIVAHPFHLCFELKLAKADILVFNSPVQLPFAGHDQFLAEECPRGFTLPRL